MRPLCARPSGALAAVIALCAGLSASNATAELPGVRAELVVGGLSNPLFLAAPPGDTRLFVLERAGRIKIVQGGAVTGTFLDISSQVGIEDEGGLLGLAFAADYFTSGKFYVYYTEADNDSVLSRFVVSADPDVADPAETRILEIDQPDGSGHKGGTIAFGDDGFLYWGIGDGGLQHDPEERAQDLNQLLGKILRLDVADPPAPGSIPVAGANYAIPGDNPFAALEGARDEIWSYGLRNPYRWSFDRLTSDMWIADVGQGLMEEINFEAAADPGGRNWGWDVMEGTLCHTNDPAPFPPCNDPSLTLPIHEYSHVGSPCSITGGYVLRAPSMPMLHGLYFYADFCTGGIWTLDPGTLQVIDRTSELAPAGGTTHQIVGFGEDGAGEQYVVLYGTPEQSDGSVYRVALNTACSNGEDDDGDGLTDFPADPGCANAAAVMENPRCSDGLDNDGDTRIDLADPACRNRKWWNRESGRCGLGFELALLLPGLSWLRRRVAVRAA